MPRTSWLDTVPYGVIASGLLVVLSLVLSWRDSWQAETACFFSHEAWSALRNQRQRCAA